MNVTNPYQSPTERKPPRAVGVVFIIMSVVTALSSVILLIACIDSSFREDLVVPCLLWMVVVNALAVLTFWLGMRRLHRNDHQVDRPYNPYAQPADEHDDGADRGEHD